MATAVADGVLLAAGFSSRAGCFKMTAEIGGRPLLLWGLETMAAACERVIVVAGFAAHRVRALVAGRPGVELVVNENFAAGMLSSVQAGAARVRAARFFVLPGDLPLVGGAVYRRLLETDAEIAVPVHDGRRGHPVLLDRRLLGALLDEPGESSLGRFIGRRRPLAVEVDDPGILADLDEARDMKQINAMLDEGVKR
jgi:molybdenum cofactor cytidylyltransferase